MKYPSDTLYWQTKKVRVAYLALLWVIAGILRLEGQYGIKVRRSRWDEKA